MKTLKTLKHIIFSFAFVLALGMMLAAGTEAKAATTTVVEKDDQTPEVVSIGSQTYVYGNNIKINGKAIKKSKKKVRALLDSESPKAYRIMASCYDREFYNSAADYEKASRAKYYPAYGYYFYFKKAGTYTFTWDTYDCDYEWASVPGQTYEIRNVTVYKTTHTKSYKVVKDTNVFKYVKLGKAKYTYSRKSSETSSSSTTAVKKYLTGTSGKLNIKTNSNYAITSIIVMTYDKEGNRVYTQVANKQNVAYGLNAYDTTLYNVVAGVDKNKGNLSRQLMKRTYVYIGYQDKFTGAYSKFTIKTDAQGEKYIETEWKNAGADAQVQKDTNYNYFSPDGSCYNTFVFSIK